MLDGILGRVADTLPSRGDERIHRECRRCGTTVSPGVVSCPHCGAREIARLELR